MSGPPFTMSKYATELDLLRAKCAHLEEEIRQHVALEFDVIFGKINGEEAQARSVNRFTELEKSARALGILPGPGATR